MRTETLSAVEYLTRKGIKYHKSGLGELRSRCPICQDQEESFSINEQSGAWQCHRASCNARGRSVYSLMRRLGDAPGYVGDKKTYRKPPSVAVTEPTEKLKKWFNEMRGISNESLEAFPVKQSGGEIVFEYWRGEKLLNRKYRTANKSFRQDTGTNNNTLWNADRIDPQTRELVITEGELDAMSVFQLGIPHVVSMPGGASNLNWIDQEYDWLERFDTIFICTDFDGPGEEAAQEIARRLNAWQCRRLRLPDGCKDANDALRSGLSSESFLELYAAAPVMGLGLVRPAEDYLSELLKPAPPAYSTGDKLLDHVLDGGFHGGETYLWTGLNEAGKTTRLNQLAINMLQGENPVRTVIASLEMPIRVLLETMMRQAGLVAGEENVHIFFDTVSRGNLYFVDAVDVLDEKTIFEAFRYGAERLGAAQFILDSLLRVDLPLGDDFYNRQKQFMNAVVQFAHTYGVMVHVVTHPRKPSNDNAVISRFDIAGTSALSDLAHAVFSMQRLSDDEAEERGYSGIFRVLKNRRTGKHCSIKLRFNSTWGRYEAV